MWGGCKKEFLFSLPCKQEAVRFQKREQLRLDAGDNFCLTMFLRQTHESPSLSVCTSVCPEFSQFFIMF